MYPIIDISTWEHEDVSVSGSKEKRWYRNPCDHKLHLFKLPVSITSLTWKFTNEYSGEMWTEKIATELGSILHLDIHKVNIATLDATPETIEYYNLRPEKIISGKIYGALCESFLIESV